MLKAIAVLIVTALIFAACATGPLVPWQGEAGAPKLVLPDLNNRTRDLENLRGRVVVVNFWASWCPPCREEMPSLWRLRHRFRDRNLEVIAVNMGERKEVIKAFLVEEMKRDFIVLMDQDQITTRSWKLLGFPTTYVIDKQGQIAYRYTGPLEWDREDVTRVIEKLLSR